MNGASAKGAIKSYWWSDLTTEEFASLDRQNLIAILPVAATEQHGPHLPVSVDADIVRILMNRVLDIAPTDLPILVLPSVDIGLSPEHADFPGTLTISAETLVSMLSEIGASVARSGIRKLALVNSHGGQSHILDIVAQKLRVSEGMVVASLNAYRYWDVAGTFGEEEASFGIHGGAAETSIMLHAKPESVRRDKLEKFKNTAADMSRRYESLRPYGRSVGLGWQMQDLNPAGAAGDSTIATAQAGADLIESAAGTLLGILRELADLDPDEFLK
jgi:creatinine amidohydrolase